MARTITEYEPDDIDLKDNPVHVLILAGVLVGAMTLISPRNPDDKDAVDLVSRKVVANFLSMLEKDGYSLVKQESVPAAFEDIFKR